MSGRLWTDEELDLLRTHYKHRPNAVAGSAGRTQRAGGPDQGRGPGAGQAANPAGGAAGVIRARHQAGRLDSEIHAEWIAAHPEAQLCRKSVRNYRRKLGLPVNAERRLEVRRAAYQKQLAVLGIPSIQVFAVRRQRRIAMQAGLPLDLRPLRVRVFEVLRGGGYWTRQEIAAAIGARNDCQRTWFKCRYGSQSALANLVHRGLVSRTVGRTRKGGGKGQRAYKYWVPIDVLQRLRPRSMIA